MNTHDDFRFNAHRHLLNLDATTNHLMMLVVAGEVSGSTWSEALSRQQVAIEEWAGVHAGVHLEPLPALDGRPANTILS